MGDADHAGLYAKLEEIILSSEGGRLPDGHQDTLLDAMEWSWGQMSIEEQVAAEARSALRTLPRGERMLAQIRMNTTVLREGMGNTWNLMLRMIPLWPKCSWISPSGGRCLEGRFHAGYHVAPVPKKKALRPVSPWIVSSKGGDPPAA